ncbi:hypothetical protein Tco_0714596, partial [Tanacetum coccineum]
NDRPKRLQDEEVGGGTTSVIVLDGLSERFIKLEFRSDCVIQVDETRYLLHK